ncbi:hypothetical protein AV530_003325 [Patagioenas fasciata monilis]|uniref:Uncharacterized protein n=1 Tax=Patagioenas fasciata monilis TaxID=372326 RepID=A0A1V4K2B0_PATFA|nr:hypothetical protein AV530_003325 [Patagioenas fasciata monilis]
MHRTPDSHSMLTNVEVQTEVGSVVAFDQKVSVREEDLRFGQEKKRSSARWEGASSPLLPVTGKNLIGQSKQHEVEDLVQQETPNGPRDRAEPPDTIVP